MTYTCTLYITCAQDERGEVVVADVDQLVWKVLGRSETTDLAGMDETQIAR
jgi:hypothetical protein